ncbi:MAG: ammonia-forming cytochrome c nitrite reductase subunit c552 [Oscillospiraceae bacterium]|nr:ammonia-forming cytochrome c nitrite reductase subunit c552 [Oscillospiraceae bacterium]
MKNKLPSWLVLTLIGVIVAALLGGVDLMTRDRIAENAERQAVRDRQAVFAAADEFRSVELGEDSSVDACYEAYSNGELIGYVTQLTVTGCQGPVEVLTGFDLEGNILAVQPGGQKFKETPGLGSRVQEPAFLDQFAGLAVPLKLKETVDAVSGATISSASVVSAVNSSGYFLQKLVSPSPELDLPEDTQFGGVLPGATTKEAVSPAPEGVDELYTSDAGAVVYVTGKGRNGDIQVQVGVAHSGQVAGIYIDPAKHQETPGKGDLIEQDYFLFQFLGKDAAQIDGGVDAVSGATISCDAVTTCVLRAVEAAKPYLDESKAYDIAPLYEGAVASVEAVEHAVIKVNAVAEKVQTHSGVVVMTAADWQDEYPEIYESWMQTRESDEVTDYLEDYPMLRTLYEGYGFAISYSSARGHYYDVDDLLETGRPHALANCFTCKTPQFTNMVNEMGDEAYRLAFEDVQQQINEGISCYNCHANTPGTVVVTHTYLTDSVGDDFDKIDAATLACGQCHNEYYFDPVTKAAKIGHNSIESMHPDAILDFFNNLMVDGQPFADWTNPRTGVRQIKVQHPEIETFLLEGSPHRDTFTCADCHMPEATRADGTTYPSHNLVSPLDDPELIANNCAQCHADLVSEVHAVQEEAERRTYAIGYELQYLTERLAAAVASGAYTEDELNAIRAIARDAQFYWDFVFVENAEGAHNPALTHECLDKAEALCNQAMLLFKTQS